MHNKKVRVGVIGSGFMGRAHSICYGLTGQAELEVICSRTAERAEAVAKEYGYRRWTTDWQDVVNDPNIDLVDITVPNYLHKEIAVACARAKKDFVIEKPLARNVKEADEIIRAVEDSGVKAYYAEDMRYAPNYCKAKEIIEQGGIGRPFMIRVHEMHDGPFHAKWFWDAELTGGGVVIDVGIHGLYVMEWLMGAKIVSVFAQTDVLKWHEYCKNGAEDNAVILFRFDNGAVGEMVNSWAISGGMDTGAQIFGTSGNIYLDAGRTAGGMLCFSTDGYGKSLEEKKSDRPHPMPTRGWHFPVVDEWNLHGHAPEIREFVRAKLENRTSVTSIYDGRRALVVVEAIYESAKSGRPVSVGA
ncbi:MAG TPA: Gfo/Idh/MocA family oxidoreductase [Firmicutes bacterium]|nr:Gfo/Idh/MocA family oxidoreductase [Bacillota bacterium]